LREDVNGATTPGNSSQVGIEEFFNDPALISFIDQALVGNQELRILNEDVRIASNDVLARRGAYRPFVADPVLHLIDRASPDPGRSPDQATMWS
jgi:outer membrane protein, multidrug efflux system